MFLIEGVFGSKTYLAKSCSERQITLGSTPFQNLLGPPCGHFGFYSRCGIAGGERIEVIFIVEVIFIFEVVFIYEVVLIF